MLSKDRLHQLFDYKDGNFYWKLDKGRAKKGDKANRLCDNRYEQIKFDQILYSFHRAVFMYHHGYLPQTVDHINNNKLDNRIENLRPASHSQNNANTKLRKSNTTGIKNVSWNKARSVWRVTVENKQIGAKFQKDFENLELAELVAMEARNKYHGTFANHGTGVA
jgi:HNH endonuclease